MEWQWMMVGEGRKALLWEVGPPLPLPLLLLQKVRWWMGLWRWS